MYKTQVAKRFKLTICKNILDGPMNRELVPHMYMDQLPGIPGIDGIELNYGSWHLLNEALTCFLNNEHYACIACLAGSLELWLKRKLGSRKSFKNMIKQAEESGIITKSEATEFSRLRKTRNMYIHFDRARLPRFETGKTAEFQYKKGQWKKLYEKELDPYPTNTHKDSLPLGFLAVTSYFCLNDAIRFYMKRYPRKDSLIDSYYRFILTNIEGLDENKVLVLLEKDVHAESSRKNRLLTSLRKIFNFQ